MGAPCGCANNSALLGLCCIVMAFKQAKRALENLVAEALVANRRVPFLLLSVIPKRLNRTP
jgi:hypothetical protein